MAEEKIIREGDRVLVLGLGITGKSAARFCVANGARVVAADERPRDRLPGLEDLPPEVEIVTGMDLPKGRDFDLVIPSPGIPSERYRDNHARILGDEGRSWAGGAQSVGGRLIAAPMKEGARAASSGEAAFLACKLLTGIGGPLIGDGDADDAGDEGSQLTN